VEEVCRALALIFSSQLNVHVVVVNNGGTPLSLLQDRRLTVIDAPSNLGYGRAHNLAIALGRSRSAYHLLANTDIEYSGDPLLQLSQLMNADDSIGLLAPRIRYPDGRLQANARLLPSPLDLFAKRLPSAWLRRRRDRFLLSRMDLVEQTNVPFLTGPFMFFRTSVLQSLGGFDPRYFVFGEDVDLSRRAHAVARTVYEPRIEITHYSRSETSRSFRRLMLLASGYVRYFNKWGWWRDSARHVVNHAALRRLTEVRD
jgi:GT2 family glycosyltransferase